MMLAQSLLEASILGSRVSAQRAANYAGRGPSHAARAKPASLAMPQAQPQACSTAIPNTGSMLSRYEHVQVTSREEWRAWLGEQHTQTESIWLVMFKKHMSAKYVPYAAAVEEALCFGWVDGTRMPLDVDRFALLLSPRCAPWWPEHPPRACLLCDTASASAFCTTRRAGDAIVTKLNRKVALMASVVQCCRRKRSVWSAVNKERVARLIVEGRMAAAGLAQIEIAKECGTWTLLDDVAQLVVPDDLAAAFAADAEAARAYEARCPSAKRSVLYGLKLAKRPETRARRIAAAMVELAAEATQGRARKRGSFGGGGGKTVETEGAASMSAPSTSRRRRARISQGDEVPVEGATQESASDGMHLGKQPSTPQRANNRQRRDAGQRKDTATEPRVEQLAQERTLGEAAGPAQGVRRSTRRLKAAASMEQ